ncbi:MAG: hypothetical protein Q3976_07840 [Corynebacterium sp.]|nr:hypothetical protein [Corynebacterium sp.]
MSSSSCSLLLDIIGLVFGKIAGVSVAITIAVLLVLMVALHRWLESDYQESLTVNVFYLEHSHSNYRAW